MANTEVPHLPREQEAASDVERRALEHVWVQSQGIDWEEIHSEGGLKVLSHAKGSTVFDVNGAQYLDGLAGLFVVAIGHGRTEIGEAMARQAGRLAYVSAHRYTSAPVTELADTLAQLTVGDLDRTFFCSGGSEAVETALKIARQAQVLRGFSNRKKIVARYGSYHGSTYGAMSVSSASNAEFFGPFVPGVVLVPGPDRFRNAFGVTGEDGDVLCAQYLEAVVEAEGPDTIAAVIGEPISTSAGVHPPSPEYWRIVRDVCDRHGILLIMDEVITGFGRTGKMFGAEHYGVVPDITTIAKGLSSGYAPIGGVVVRPSVFDEFTANGASLSHLLTFGGQVVSAAAATKNIEILLDEDLVTQSAAKGEYLRDLLNRLTTHPTVADIRGVGLLWGIEIVRDKTTKEGWGGEESPFIRRLRGEVERSGLLTRTRDVTVLCPPLVVTHAELDRMVAILDESLSKVEREFAREIERF